MWFERQLFGFVLFYDIHVLIRMDGLTYRQMNRHKNIWEVGYTDKGTTLVGESNIIVVHIKKGRLMKKTDGSDDIVVVFAGCGK